MPRLGTIDRQTRETQVRVELNLDGNGQARLATGIGFFDHMLELMARHALWDLQVQAQGDLHVDSHHTVEDVGLVLGQALAAALGDKRGIRRYGHSVLPMDDALVTAAVDLSGRAFLVYDVKFPATQVGGLDTELIQEFWRAFSGQAACNLHVLLQHGLNSHHIAEAVFKATARALRMATELDPRDRDQIPSTKGTLGSGPLSATG